MPHEGCAVSLRIAGTTADCGKQIVGSRLFSYGNLGLWVNYCEAHRGLVDRVAATGHWPAASPVPIEAGRDA